MNDGLQPTPEPDPRRLSVESLEAKLRALPKAAVPESLASQLVAAIPAVKGGGSGSSGFKRRWPWVGAVGIICIAVSAGIYSWVMLGNSKPPAASDGKRAATPSSSPGKNSPGPSKGIEAYQKTVQFDPYNADAWFALAKAQAAANRPADAISSAQKAVDVARSR